MKKDKAELQGHLELSEAVSTELRDALIDLEPKYEALVSEKAALEAAGERARDTIIKIEVAKQKEQEEHQATRDVVKRRDGALAEARAQINALQDEISAGRRELDRLSSTLAEREVAYETVASALRNSEEQGRMLKTLLDESTFQTARLSRTVSVASAGTATGEPTANNALRGSRFVGPSTAQPLPFFGSTIDFTS